MQSRNRPKYKSSVDFDYHHEKVALVKLARDLLAEGWPEVRLSVSHQRLDEADLDGVDPEEVRPFDDAFVSEFNTTDELRYQFYRDEPGRIDLVARKPGRTLLVEAKGQSARNRVGAVEQLIGRMLLLQDPHRDDRDYAILVPDTWDSVLPSSRPSLDWLHVFRISARDGSIERGRWPSATGSTAAL